MTKDSKELTPSKTLNLDLDWRWHRPKARRAPPRGEPRQDERPLRCESGGEVVSAPARHLPFGDDQFDVVNCGTVFAFVRDDESLVSELARVTAPNGIVHLRVPAKGPLAVFDAFNLHRYVVDITKRGLRPFETADIGWRRHYSEDDLITMFGPCQFDAITTRRSGVAVSESIRMSGFLLFRWWRASRNWYRRVSRIAHRVLTLEEKLAWRHGFWLDASFRRKDDAVRCQSGPR